MSSLSVQDEVITRYLTPLLSKHNRKQEIHWEDLSQAKQAADGLLSQAPKSKETEQASDALQSLHKSQIIAYREQATASLQEWCQTWKLPAIVDSESQEEYSQRCLQEAFEERPFWKLGTGILQKILSPIIKERAVASFTDHSNKQQSQQQLENDAAATTELKASEEVDGKEDENQEEDGEMEEDDNEDGEMDDGEDGEGGGVEDHHEEEDQVEVEEEEAKEEDESSKTKQPLAKKTKNDTGKKRIVAKKTIQHKKKVQAASTTTEGTSKTKKSAPWTSKRGRGGGAAGGSKRASS